MSRKRRRRGWRNGTVGLRSTVDHSLHKREVGAYQEQEKRQAVFESLTGWLTEARQGWEQGDQTGDYVVTEVRCGGGSDSKEAEGIGSE